MTTILLNAQNPISRAEAVALVTLIEAMEEHLSLVGQPGLDTEERAGLTKLRTLAGIETFSTE